jgi:hypothetical protein
MGLLAPVFRTLRDHENAPLWMRRLGAFFLRFGPHQITCAEFERFVMDYYGEQLTARQRSMFDFHMRICPMCDVHFQSYVKAIEMGRELFKEEEALQKAELPPDLVMAILETRRADR